MAKVMAVRAPTVFKVELSEDELALIVSVMSSKTRMRCLASDEGWDQEMAVNLFSELSLADQANRND